MQYYFIDLATYEIFDYAGLKLRYPGSSFPVDPSLPGVDSFIAGENIARFYEIPAPITELWETAEVDLPTYKFNSSNGHWERNWYVRDLTQPELDALNAARIADAIALRRAAYEDRSDPIFMQAQRGETTSQAWLDEINQIKIDYPKPPIITLPES